jgi:uncharacterized protein YbjT (DUF2867 family)
MSGNPNIKLTTFMSDFRSTIEAEADGRLLVVRQALRPEVRLQMIAIEDIGKFAAIELAGAELIPSEIAESIERVSGKPTRFVELPMAQLRRFDAKIARMYEWFNESGYQADIPTLQKLHPELLTLEMWLKQSGLFTVPV